MKAILAAAVIGVSLHPLIVKELRTKIADFPNVNSEFVEDFSPNLEWSNLERRI